MKAKAILTVLTLASTMTTGVSAAPSQSTAPTSRAVAEQWASQCTANPFVQERIHHLTADEVIAASKVLDHGGMLGQIRQLEFEEACLSLAGTALAKAPVITLNFRRDNPMGMGASRELKESIEQRLENLDIGYSLPVAPADEGTPAQKLYQTRPKSLKQTNWQAFTGEIRADSRSLAGGFKGHCVILHDTHPFGDYARRILNEPLRGYFTGEDLQWLNKHGAAMEFWHEVSHCANNSLNMFPTPHGGAVELAIPEAPENAKSAQLMVDPEGAASAIEQGSQPKDSNEIEDLLAKASTNNATGIAQTSEPQQSPVECPVNESAFAEGEAPPPPSGDQKRKLSLGFMTNLKKEVEADLFGHEQLEDRFDVASRGCRNFRNPEHFHPWDKFRLAMSMFAPEFNFMTWLNPWLHELGPVDQMQVALEAWEATQNVAFDELEVPHQSPLVRRLAERQSEVGVWNVAGHEADPDRVARWEHWLSVAFTDKENPY